MTLKKEVVLTALKCMMYTHTNKRMVNRDHDGYTILAVEGTNETTDWVTNLKFLIKTDNCHTEGFIIMQTELLHN